jgi:hypothetical protein
LLQRELKYLLTMNKLLIILFLLFSNQIVNSQNIYFSDQLQGRRIELIQIDDP